MPSFTEVAEAPTDEEGDLTSEPELMADAPAQSAQQQAQLSASSVQPASAEDAFWTRMDSMFKRERDCVTIAIREEIGSLEKKVKAELETESKRRDESDAKLEDNLGLVIQRVAKLEVENRAQGAPRSKDVAGDDWQANHATLGPDRVADVEHLCRLLPHAMQTQHRRP